MRRSTRARTHLIAASCVLLSGCGGGGGGSDSGAAPQGPSPPPPPPTFSYQILNVPAFDIAWSATRNVLFASLGASGQDPARIVAIDPATGAISQSIPTPSAVRPLVITDDGAYLYAGLADGKVRRIRTADLTTDIEFDLGLDRIGAPLLALDMASAPGNSRTLAVVRITLTSTPSTYGIAIYDDGVQRSVVAGGQTSDLLNTVHWDANGAQIYSINVESSGFCFYTVAVSANGATVDSCVPNVFNAYNAVNGGIVAYSPLQQAGGKFYSAITAEVFDPASRSMLGRFHTSSQSVVIDAARNLAFFGSRSIGCDPPARFESHNLARMTLVSTQTVPEGKGEVRKLLRWGSNGLAAITACSQVIIASGTFVSSAPSAAAPGPGNLSATSGNAGAYSYRTVQLDGNDLIWDRTRGRLHVSVEGTDPTYGNTIVSIDPAQLRVTSAVSIPGDPIDISLSDDGQKLYVAPRTATHLRRLSMPQMTSDFSLPFVRSDGSPSQPLVVRARPGHPLDAAVIHADRMSGTHNPVMIHEQSLLPNTYHDMAGTMEWTDASTLYTHNPHSSALTFARLHADADGLTVLSTTSPLFGGSSNHLVYSGGLMYDENGIAVDPATATVAGTFPISEGFNNPAFLAVAERNRGYLAYDFSRSALVLRIYDLQNRTLVDEVRIPQDLGEPLRIAQMDTHGLAITLRGGPMLWIRGPAL